MAPPHPKRQRLARASIDRLFAEAANVWVIHYSCESFYERPEGRSPRVTSIALRRLDTAQTASFSIHQVAEREGICFNEIEQRYDDLEKRMLDDFFGYIGSHKGMKYLHWNMRDINYGFAAIEHRYRVLQGEPFIVDDINKFDLARLLIDIYGVGYIGHPRLEKLIAKNNIQPMDFLSGSEEAAAFDNREFVRLHQSTLRKVDVIANIAQRAHDRRLKCNATWWEMQGGRVGSVLNWVVEHKLITFAASLASIIGLVLAF